MKRLFTHALLMPCVLLAEPVSWTLDQLDRSIMARGQARVAEGVVQQSLVLDGSSVLELRDSAALGSQEAFTVSVWFNAYEPEGSQQMIVGKNRYSSNERAWGITLEPDGTVRAHLRQQGWTVIAGKKPVDAGRWHQAVLVISPARAALYLNGDQVGEAKLALKLPNHATPVTLGGIWDAGHARQTFHGALDDLKIEPRAWTADEVKAGYLPVTAVHDLPKPKLAGFPLWDDSRKLGVAAELPVLKDVEFHVIKKWDKQGDGYTFLHGVGLAWHKGRLYASIGHNLGEENTVTEEAQYRVSEDGGRTWGPLQVIDAGDEKDLAVSHGVFLSHQGRLWAFHGAYYGKMERIHTRAYSLDEVSGKWIKHGVVVENGFWALNQPVPMADGNWIMPGISAGVYSEKGTHPAAVAISHGDDFTRWDFVSIPVHQGVRMWGESSIIVQGAEVLNISRYGGKPLALTARSQDYGRTWTVMGESNLPMTTSKPAAGMLSTGQRYLVATNAASNGGRRSPLTIAVSEPGQKVFSKVFVIRHAVREGPGESNAKASLSYPCAIEHDGRLYVGFSNNGGRGSNYNSAEMAVIPLSSLKTGP